MRTALKTCVCILYCILAFGLGAAPGANEKKMDLPNDGKVGTGTAVGLIIVVIAMPLLCIVVTIIACYWICKEKKDPHRGSVRVPQDDEDEFLTGDGGVI